MQTTADRLLAKKKKELEQERLTEEEAKDLKKACRDLFSTQKGIKVARYMMRASGIYRLNKNTQNPLDMAAERGKEWMYLTFVKGVLSPEQLLKIERKDD